MNLLYVDNYDSFAFTLMAYLTNQGAKVTRITSDQSLDSLPDMSIDRIVLGPGPNGPRDAGNYQDILKVFEKTVPILGICLGHQVILDAYGTRIQKVPPMHGVASQIEHDSGSIFKGLEANLVVARYHSLGALCENVQNPLYVTARTGEVVMGVKHKEYDVEGIQFHPESILAPHERILENFLNG